MKKYKVTVLLDVISEGENLNEAIDLAMFNTSYNGQEISMEGKPFMVKGHPEAVYQLKSILYTSEQNATVTSAFHEGYKAGIKRAIDVVRRFPT